MIRYACINNYQGIHKELLKMILFRKGNIFFIKCDINIQHRGMYNGIDSKKVLNAIILYIFTIYMYNICTIYIQILRLAYLENDETSKERQSFV